MSLRFLTGRWLLRIRPAPLASLLKRVLFVRRVELPTAEGTFWVDPASMLGAALDDRQIYEPLTLAAIKRLLQPGDTFVDIGANEGYFSVVAARRVGPTGRVIAVEPQHRLQAVLRRNFALNDCPRVEVVAAAVSDRPGEVQLHLTPDMNNSASSLAATTRYRLPTQPVTCVTLAKLFARHDIRPGAVVKMDIESWEYEAILGSPDLFRSGCIRALILELHPSLLTRRQRDPAEVERFLIACGYERPVDMAGLVWVHRVA